MEQNTKVFGVPFQTAVIRSDPKEEIPKPLRAAITWLNKHALDEEGLYRVPGSESKWIKYRDMFDAGKDVDFEALDERCPENVACIVTKFIKFLPESLFMPLHKDFEGLSEEDPKFKEKFKDICSKLPFANRETIRFLAKHFQLVTLHSNKNLMPLSNISRTLGIMYGNTYAKVFSTLILDISLCPSTVVFEIPIEEAVKISNPEGKIPTPLKVCVDWIERENKWSDDIYISSGSWIQINKYKARFNRGENILIPSDEDVDVITGVISLYMYDIPENLFTHKFKNKLVAIAELPSDKQLPEIKKVMDNVPSPQIEIASFLVKHLRKACDNSKGKVKPLHIGFAFGGSYKTLWPLIIPFAYDLFGN